MDAGASSTTDTVIAKDKAWSFDDDSGVDLVDDAEAEDSGVEPTDGDDASRPEPGGGNGLDATAEPVEDFDPCTLVTLEEWAQEAGVDQADASSRLLEGGEACGWLTRADQLRMAASVFSTDGGSFLPDDVKAKAVEVGGRSGRWVERYPVPDSSLLVIDVDGAELVIEMSARDKTGQQGLLSHAKALAALALGRVVR